MTQNILHLIHSDEPGGAESMLLSLCTSLEERGFHSMVGLAGGGWLAEHLPGHRIPWVPLQFRHTGDWRLVGEIRRVIREHQISVVHTHLSRMNLYGGIAAALAGVPVVATLHGKDFGGRWGRVSDWMIGKFSNRVVAVSADLSRALEQRHWPTDRIRVIHNGVEPGPESARELVRRELGLDADDFVIGTIGRLESVKAYPLLLAASEQLMSEHPGVRVIFIGDGSERRALEEEARSRGIAERVSFLGTRNDARRLLAAMDLFVLCSYSEGLSISLLEAMWAGLPVVATQVGGNPEVIEDRVTGLLVPPSDPEMLAAAILFLIRRPSIAQQCGLRARERVAEEFSVQAMTQRYAALYEELLRERGNTESFAGGGRIDAGDLSAGKTRL